MRRHRVELEALARRHGVPWEATESPADLTARAARAAAEGVERLLVAGGDGSQHLAVQGLIETGTALAPLPLGSGDDLAVSLGVPPSLEKAFAFLLQAPTGAIDAIRCADRTDFDALFDAPREAGRARHVTPRPTFAAGVASVGFDAAVSVTAHRMRRVPRSLLYRLAALRTLVGFRAPRLSLRWDAGGWSGAGLFLAVANTPLYGGGMRVAPDARPDDGVLDLIVVERVSRATVLRLFPRIYSGRHVEHPKVHVLRSRSVDLVADRPLPAQGDGEALGDPSARWSFEIVPASLRVVRRRTRRPAPAAAAYPS